ncbi:MAG: DUF262 domain-containing protein [Hyphomicrobiaceae bacterium]|nr:MAG: DUF262 domain-containing protein [Hyphomicrobiaceae bacterium]KAB2851821.1 MAG: DUF262 domain-containing protein [Hyphomicrobiaceae bacterium]
MPSQFAANSIRLDQLFADPFLIETPAYQRGFAWTAQEAGRLLDDIMAALEGGEEVGEQADYFLGTMLFIDCDRSAQGKPGWPLSGPPRAFEVVDGLQRLTTLTILFCVLRDLDAEAGGQPDGKLLGAIGPWQATPARHRLLLRDGDEQFLLAHARRPGACRTTPASERLAPAQAQIIEVRDHFLGVLAELDAAERRRLTEFLLARCYVVLIATIGIDRAYRMFTVLNDTGKPLARNDILKAELLGSVPAAGAAAAAACWNEAEARLGTDFESLFSHIRAMYGRPGGNVIAGIRAIAAESGGAEAFIQQVLRPAAHTFDEMRNARHGGSACSAEITRTLGYLGWLPASDWVPAVLLWWLRKGKDAAELAWFLAAIDRLAYGLRIINLSTSRRTQRFGTIISALRNGHDLKATPSPLELSNDELRTIDYNLRNLHARNASTAKLVLLRLNDRIAGAAQTIDVASITVEHVLPRKHGANSRWRAWYPDPEEREQCTQSLGNLVLVSKAQNDKAGNLDFAHKQAVYFAANGPPVPAINESLRRQTEWKAAQVKAREAELLEVMRQLWSFGSLGAQRNGQGAGRRRGGPQAA